MTTTPREAATWVTELNIADTEPALVTDTSGKVSCAKGATTMPIPAQNYNRHAVETFWQRRYVKNLA